MGRLRESVIKMWFSSSFCLRRNHGRILLGKFHQFGNPALELNSFTQQLQNPDPNPNPITSIVLINIWKNINA
jgi:hypothetical protein